MMPAVYTAGVDGTFCQSAAAQGIKRKCESLPANCPASTWDAGEAAVKRLRCFADESSSQPMLDQGHGMFAHEQGFYADATGHDIALHGELEEKGNPSAICLQGRLHESAVEDGKPCDLMDTDSLSQGTIAVSETAAACNVMDAEGCPNHTQQIAFTLSNLSSVTSPGSMGGSGAVRRRGYCRPFWDGVLAPYPYVSDIY